MRTLPTTAVWRRCRHVGGARAGGVFVPLTLKAQSAYDRPRALRMRHLLLAVMKAESAITGPFRQVC
jgi:hypothetical protein